MFCGHPHMGAAGQPGTLAFWPRRVARTVTTFTIASHSFPRVPGARVLVLTDRNATVHGYIERASDHELLVRVGGRALAFQKHDGESWTWSEWTQGELGTDTDDRERLL